MQNDNVKFKNFNIEIFLITAVLFLLPFYFIKFKYNWISLNLIEVLILTLLLFWIFDRNKKYLIPVRLASQLEAGGLNTQYSIPALLIFAGLFLSIVVNKNYYVGLGILKGWFILPVLFALIFYDSLKRNERLLNLSLAAIFCGGIFVSIEGIYYWVGNLLTYDGRLAIFYDSSNQLAMFLAPAFLIGLKFGFEELPRFYRGKEKAELWKIGVAITGVILIAINLYLTKSYGAWVAIVLALATAFWLKHRKLSQRGLLVFFLILILVVGAVSVSKYENIKKLGGRSSLASRMMIWKSAGLMMKNSPLFGIGPGNFQNKYLEYQKYFPPYLEWAVPQPHNLFLAFWLEAGIIGLAGFILLLIQFFRDNKKARGYNLGAGLLCLGIILYFLIHGLIDTTYWRNDMTIVFWAVVAMNFYLAESSQTTLKC